MSVASSSISAPQAPGSLGVAAPSAELFAYLSQLEMWLDGRRREVDELDAAAKATPRPDEFTQDIVLSLTLWQAIRTRTDAIEKVWDSGRADAIGRERISQLLWGRLDSGSGAELVSLVEAAKLCDAVVSQLRTKLSFDPQAADLTSRIRTLRAQLVRCEDLASDAESSRVKELSARLEKVSAQAARGADVTGPLGELETEMARTERDLIVGVSRRRVLEEDREAAAARLAALDKREPALRDLAARCRREIANPPKLAVPDVDRLGEPPATRAELDAFVARLGTVSRALDTVEDVYAKPLRERAELRYRLERYAAKAAANGRDASPTVRSGLLEAREAVEAVPCDVTMARFLVDQYEFLTRDLPFGGPEGVSS